MSKNNQVGFYIGVLLYYGVSALLGIGGPLLILYVMVKVVKYAWGS